MNWNTFWLVWLVVVVVGTTVAAFAGLSYLVEHNVPFRKQVPAYVISVIVVLGLFISVLAGITT